MFAVPGLLLLAVAPGGDVRLSEAITLQGEFPWEAPASMEAWNIRRAQVRRRVMVAAGLWPAPVPVDVEAPVIHGAIQREGYTVEKVYFESLPGFHITGNLYRPSRPGPLPAVLCPHGHWTDGRFSSISDEKVAEQLERGEERELENARYHLQARCATLAGAGHVVFHYDMVGFADSRQLSHDGDFGDLEAELWGMSHFGLQTLNSIRSLEFLISLPQVDRDRVAVTGGSGGGTQTFILGAVDDRPGLLFPAVMVSTAMQGGCVCENASHLRVGTGNIELAAMAAPRPLGLTGADDWTKEIMTKGAPQLRELYDLVGAVGHLGAWCYPEQPHNYNLIARQHLYGFLEEHFGSGVPAGEPGLVPIEPRHLTVYDDDHPRPTGGIAEVRAQLLEIARGQLVHLADLSQRRPEEYRRVVGGALEILVAPRELAPPAERLEQLLGPGGAMTIHVRGTGVAQAPLELVDSTGEGGSEGEVGPLLIQTVATSGASVGEIWNAAGGRRLQVEVLLEVNDEGPHSLPVDTSRHGRYIGYTHGYNRTLFAERVGDILAAIELGTLDSSGERVGRVALHGGGESSPWLLIAAALAGDRVDRVAVEYGWDFDDLESTDDPNFLPGALRWGGMDYYTALIAPRPLLLIGCDEVPAIVRKAYLARGAEEAVRAMPSIEDSVLAGWLAGEEL